MSIGVHSKRKEFASEKIIPLCLREKTFLLEKIPFQKGLHIQEANKNSKQLSPFLKLRANFPAVDVNLKELNPSLAEHDMPCLSKLGRSRSVGFCLKKPTDLDLHCLPLNM